MAIYTYIYITTSSIKKQKSKNMVNFFENVKYHSMTSSLVTHSGRSFIKCERDIPE